MFNARVLTVAAAATLVATGAMAADPLMSAPVYNAPVYDYDSGYTDFEGFYAGIYGGGLYDGGLVGSVGILAGVNFSLSDLFYLGGEFQGGLLTDGNTFTYDALGLGRLGVLLTDDALIYGAVGGGIVDGDTVYAFGGGVEFAVAEGVGLRGEVLGLGAWGATPTAAKATVGLVFHID